MTVTLTARALPEQSSSPAETWAFEVTARLTNRGVTPAKVIGRRWILEDGEGRVQEIQGTGLAAAQPVLDPGVSIVHTWMCVVRTSRATLRGGVILEGGALVEAEAIELAVFH